MLDRSYRLRLARYLMSSGSNTYIAVVDDDESLRRSMARLLRTSGMQPITYKSAEDFLADEKRPEFDCLFLDVWLGGISGIELSRRLKRLGSNTPVVFSTAHDKPTFREEAFRAGCAAYLRKGDSGETVLSAIRDAIKSRQQTRVE